MRERPILFSAPMVNAILAGRKTQTRRVVKLARTRLYDHAEHGPRYETFDRDGRVNGGGPFLAAEWLGWCPYGAPGDRLWVRESFAISEEGFAYMADHPGDPRGLGWRPSIHMPRAASRITLAITGVRVERLQDIGEADAKAEGVAEYPCEGPHRGPGATYWSADGVEPFGPIKRTTPIAAFKALWEEINGDESWDDNPWVWIVEFKRIEPDHG